MRSVGPRPYSKPPRLTRKPPYKSDSTTAESGAVEQPKSAWNSLEVAKLFVGVLIPVSIAVLGITMNEQNLNASQSEARQVRNHTVAREEAIRKFNLDREEKLREATEKREQALKMASEDREDKIRQASQVVDAAVRQDNLRREEQVRRDATAHDLALRKSDEAREDAIRLREKRSVFWQEFSGLFAEVVEIDDFKNVETNPEKVAEIHIKMNKLVHEYWPYLGSRVAELAFAVTGDVSRMAYAAERIRIEKLEDHEEYQGLNHQTQDKWYTLGNEINKLIVEYQG